MPKYIYGRNPVIDAIKSKIATKIFLANNSSCREIEELAKKENINCNIVSYDELFNFVHNSHHQGVVAEIKDFSYSSIEEILLSCKGQEYPLVLLLDGIEDPQNFGAIIRSADAFGVNGIIIKKNRQVEVNPTVYKVSTGAISHVKIAMVSNLSQSIQILKKAGFWVVSSDGSATQSYLDIDYKMACAIVVGSEGFGISDLVLKNSDYIVKIPMQGHVNSLNASVATGVLLANIRAHQ